MKNILCIVLILFSNIFWGQSNINPDISLIGTFNTFTNFTKGSPEYGKLNFENPSMELFVDGYLNPFARATANVSYEGGQFGVEELYGNIVRGLPLDMQIKAGKYLVGFGKLNTIHPHAWPFLNRPLFHQVFFTPDGFNDVGIDVSFLLPTGDVYTNLDLGVFKGNSMLNLRDSIGFVNRGINPVFVGRLGSFFNIDDYTNLEVGLSSSYGIYAKSLTGTSPFMSLNEKSLKYFYAGIDFKYKYVPDAYTALTFQGEALINHRNVARTNAVETGVYINTKNITNTGGFIFADYKFDKQFSFGLKYDYTAGIADDKPAFTTLANDDKNHTQGIEGWIAFYPVEETSVVRVGVQHLIYKYTDGTNRDGETTITLQFLFSLGPHKAHPF
jgi:hypothetical protein